MKFYRVSLYSGKDGEFHYTWFTSEREAKKWLKDYSKAEGASEADEIDTVNVPTDKQGLKTWLNAFYSKAI